MADQCAINGSSDMYGLGIRLGYYLQWFGSILAPWIARGEVKGLRMTNTLFVAATFLALLIQVGQDLTPQEGGLYNVEIYIVLLLTFGSSLYLLPIFLWRFATWFDPSKDPTRWPKADPPNQEFNFLYTLLLLAVCAFQMWYWGARVVQSDNTGCTSWAFLFARIPLQEPTLRWIYFTLATALLASLLALRIIEVLNNRFGIVDNHLEQQRSSQPYPSLNSDQEPVITRYNVLDSAIKLVVAILVVMATELTIQWNHIEGVYSVAPAGQTIPLALGIAAVVIVLYKKISGEKGEETPAPGVTRPGSVPTYGMRPTRFDNVPTEGLPTQLQTRFFDIPVNEALPSHPPTRFADIPTNSEPPEVLLARRRRRQLALRGAKEATPGDHTVQVSDETNQLTGTDEPLPDSSGGKAS